MDTAKKLPKSTLRLWQIRFGALGIILTALVCVFTVFSRWLFLAAGILALLFVIWIFVFLPLYIKSYRISFDSTAISVSYGLIIRTTFIMPYPRMVYIRVFSTPVAKAMGLAGIIVKAARGALLVPEISHKDALLLMKCTSEEQSNE